MESDQCPLGHIHQRCNQMAYFFFLSIARNRSSVRFHYWIISNQFVVANFVSKYFWAQLSFVLDLLGLSQWAIHCYFFLLLIYTVSQTIARWWDIEINSNLKTFCNPISSLRTRNIYMIINKVRDYVTNTFHPNLDIQIL